MKRTATTLVLLAGLGGGGCVSPTTQAPKQPSGGFNTVTHGKEVNSVQGPMGEPVMATRGQMPAGGSGVRQAGGPNVLVGAGGYVRPAGGVTAASVTAKDGCTSCVVPGVGGSIVQANGFGGAPGYGAVGPNGPHMSGAGILPVPTMGPPGAVAAVGAMGAGGMMPRPMVTGRSSINFTGPAGMKVTWQLPDGSFNDPSNAITTPHKYNFLQGQVYRLRLSGILPEFPGDQFYPTLEIAPGNPKSLTFLAHSSVPVTFSADDFAQAKAGNLMVKVIYLPDPANQDFTTVVGDVEVISTRLEPGADPVAEAQRRGTVLAVVRMGNIDLENNRSPAMNAPPPGFMMPPGGPMPGGPMPGPAPVPPKPEGLGMKPLSANPPGTATVKPPAALPTLPTSAPTDLPPAATGPLAPIGPGPKPPTK